MLKDMMPHFDLYQPDSVEAALDLAERLGSDAWLLAAGQDTYDWLKNRTKRTSAVIDLTGIAALKGIRETDAGLEIGALTTLSEIEGNPLVTQRYSLLSSAAGRVASPHTIRDARLVCGAVECVPRRLIDVEKAIVGQTKNEELAARAGKLAAEGARPLNFNHFKMPLMENLVRRAIRET